MTCTEIFLSSEIYKAPQSYFFLTWYLFKHSWTNIKQYLKEHILRLFLVEFPTLVLQTVLVSFFLNLHFLSEDRILAQNVV